MLRSILSSFARSYGRQLGRTAARRTAWVALPLLLLVIIVGVIELASGGQLARSVAPALPALVELLR